MSQFPASVSLKWKTYGSDATGYNQAKYQHVFKAMIDSKILYEEFTLITDKTEYYYPMKEEI